MRRSPSRLDEIAARFGGHRPQADAALRRRLASCGALLIFGAGQNGALVQDLLRKAGLEPAAFLDDTPSKIGQTKAQTPIRAVAEAAAMRDAVAIVSIFTPQAEFAAIAERLRDADIEPVSLFAFLSAFGDDALPFYFLDTPESVLAAMPQIHWLADRLLDAASEALLEAQLTCRLTADPLALPPWSADRLPPPDGWRAFQFIDAGAFDGDTLLPMIEAHGARLRRAIALEPDPATFRRLEANLEPARRLTAGPISAICAAVDRTRGRRFFADMGNLGSGFADQGMEVATVCIDELVAAECDPALPLYIKFDVEGAEADALAGAARTIRERRPFLSVAAYHRPHDLWSLARSIADLDDGYRFRLRAHGADGADLNLYAVPPDA